MTSHEHRAIRLGIVEDQPLFRSMLEHTLACTHGSRSSPRSARPPRRRGCCGPASVDVVILDIDLPDGNGIALGVAAAPHARLGILLLSAHDAMDLLLDLPPDVAAGWGYLSKTSSTSEAVLVDAVARRRGRRDRSTPPSWRACRPGGIGTSPA